MALRVWLALGALTASMASGQSIVPTNWTAEDHTEYANDLIGISVSEGDNMVPLGPIVALTERAHKGIPVC